MENFKLKKPRKNYLWKVISTLDTPKIMITTNLTPKDFWWQCGQHIDGKIIEMKLIGYRITKDHYCSDVEEVYINSNKFMKQSVIDTHNKNK